MSDHNENLSQETGQFRDMMRSKSDDGTVPPSVESEAMTTGARPVRNEVEAERARTLGFGIAASGAGATHDTFADANEQALGSTADAGTHTAAPAPLSPNDPHRDSDDGTPYLDDANPYGRPIPNRQDEAMGGDGGQTDPKDPQMRVTHEQPGADSASSLSQVLDGTPHRNPEAR